MVYVMAVSWIIGWLVNYELEICGRKRSWLINTYRMCPYCVPSVLCCERFSLCHSHLNYTVRTYLIHTYRTVLLPCFNHVIMDFFESDFSRPQHSAFRTQFCMYKLKYSSLSVVCEWPVGHPNLPPLFWLLLATTWTLMKVVSRMLIDQK